MKTHIIVLILVICPNLTFGQSLYRPALQKGSIMVGGGMAFSFGNQKTDISDGYDFSYSSISLTPSVGFFVDNGIAAGLIVDLTSKILKDEYDNKVTETQYSIGPAFRWYHTGGFFAHADVSFGKRIREDESYRYESNLLKGKFGIGYSFFLNEHVSVEPGIAYWASKSKSDDYGGYETKQGEFVIGIGLNIFIHKNQ